MNLITLISLSDKDKRVILIFFLLLIVTIAFIAVIGAIITRVMRWQGKRMDDLTHDVVVTNVVNNKKDFLRYARIKNYYTFVKQSWKPLAVLFVTALVLIIHNSVSGWDYDLLDFEKTGFNSLFFVWDFSDPEIFHTFFGIKLICDWPPIINYPHFSIDAWASYIFFFGMLIGGSWYLVTLQCVIARTIRMYQLYYDLYRKSLDGFNKAKNDMEQLK